MAEPLVLGGEEHTPLQDLNQPGRLLAAFRASAPRDRAPCKPSVKEDGKAALGEPPAALLSPITAMPAEGL